MSRHDVPAFRGLDAAAASSGAGGAGSRSRADPLDVYLTVDVEVWCDGWEHLDENFPTCFRQYIHGPTARGDYGLPYQLRRLSDHGLEAVFFVEPLFSLRFGEQPLADVVGLLKEARQDVQLHLHTEWVDEARHPELPQVGAKRQYLHLFDETAQAGLIALGDRLLQRAGAPAARAFRAGSFGFDHRTLPALRRCGIGVDASYNASMFGPESGVRPGTLLTDSTLCDGLCELPMTVFVDGRRRLRHVQLTACSWPEIESLLEQAFERGQRSFTILSHGSELLDRARRRPDDVAVQRFDRLCAHLDRHRDRFRVRRLDGAPPRTDETQPPPLAGSLGRTLWRMGEQLWRRRPHWTPS